MANAPTHDKNPEQTRTNSGHPWKLGKSTYCKSTARRACVLLTLHNLAYTLPVGSYTYLSSNLLRSNQLHHALVAEHKDCILLTKPASARAWNQHISTAIVFPFYSIEFHVHHQHLRMISGCSIPRTLSFSFLHDLMISLSMPVIYYMYHRTYQSIIPQVIGRSRASIQIERSYVCLHCLSSLQVSVGRLHEVACVRSRLL
jgi:hypothetical protein